MNTFNKHFLFYTLIFLLYMNPAVLVFNLSSTGLMYAANEENKSFEANNDLAEMTVPKDKRIKIDVLLNDYGDKLKIRKVWGAKHGSAWESGSKITYQPNWDFVGEDSFKYKISEGWDGAQKTATVNVAVNGPAAPVAETLTINTEIRKKGSVKVDLEIWQEFANYTFNPKHGSAWADGKKITYDPEWSFIGGTDSFTYEIKDTYGRKATGTVNVNVEGEDPPVAKNFEEETKENKIIRINVLKECEGFNIDFDYSYNLKPSHGSAWTSRNNIVYQPDNDWSGIEEFDYRIKDDFDRTAKGKIKIQVGDPVPSFGEDDSYDFVNLGAPTWDGYYELDVLKNDDGNDLVVTGVTQPSAGEVEIGSNGKNLKIRPKAGTINYSFTYTVSNKNDESCTVNVEVTGNPEKPIANDDNYDLSELGQADWAGYYRLNVLDNDIGPFLKVNSITEAPASGEAVIGGGGNYLKFKPVSGGTQPFTLKYDIIDTSGYVSVSSATVTITGMPEAPEVRNDVYKLSSLEQNSGGEYYVKVLENDSNDLKVDTFTQPIGGKVEKPDHGNYLKFKPDVGYYQWQFSYTAINSLGQKSSSASVKIYDGSFKPEAVDDNVTVTTNIRSYINVLANDKGNFITIKDIGSPKKGTAEISNEKIVYISEPGFIGEDSFLYTVKDISGNTANGKVNITVEESSGGGGGSDVEITAKIIDATDAEVSNELNSGDPSILPAVFFLNYKHIYSAYAADDDAAGSVQGESNLTAIGNLFDQLYQLRMKIEDGTAEPNDNTTFDSGITALKSKLNN